MANRSTLSVVAFALSLAFAGAAQAQHRPHHGHRNHARRGEVTAPTRGAAQMREDGALGEGDADETGRYTHVRTVNLTRGDAVTFSVTSSDFDPLVRVEGPNGQTWQDDDGAGHGTDARLRFVAPATGRYTVTVTSYAEGEQGDFHADLAIGHGGAAATDDDNASDDDANDDEASDDGDASDDESSDDAPAPIGATGAATAAGQGTTYGIFVGITHYRGENEDLPNTAEDAQHLAQSFERAGWMERRNAVVLTDERATFDGVRQAFATIAPRVGPHDMLVFFFDGHGSADEIDLRGRDLSRRDLSRFLDSVHGRSLVVLDSCEAGGFASVVQGHADRAGLFSSRASEESSVASEVNSGGWLAYHFRRAVDGGVRRGADGSVNFDEVTRYVQAQYRQSRVSDQHLVAVRGDRRGEFAIGGAGASPGVSDNVAVARNDRRRPVMVEVPPVNGADTSDADQGSDWNPNGPQAAAGSDAFNQALNMGVGLAGGVLEALTK
jgi:Caspase domain